MFSSQNYYELGDAIGDSLRLTELSIYVRIMLDDSAMIYYYQNRSLWTVIKRNDAARVMIPSTAYQMLDTSET
jgi:hypothetical protein